MRRLLHLSDPQGSGISLPTMLAILSLNNCHVEGINCAGPIAPPPGPAERMGHERGVLSVSRPKPDIILINGV